MGIEPDVPERLRGLRGLERRRGPSGRDRVDHRADSHDDLANAVAGVVAVVRSERARYFSDAEAPVVW